MTAMWAGPLCTRLLAEWGAEVTTIEPAVRPDGFRGSPAQFAVLDVGKRRVDLDLRTRRRPSTSSSDWSPSPMSWSSRSPGG